MAGEMVLVCRTGSGVAHAVRAAPPCEFELMQPDLNWQPSFALPACAQ